MDKEAELNNGGFDQFFLNSAGDRTAATIAALKAIGANHTAVIVAKAAAKFPGGSPSVLRDARQAELEVISPDCDGFEKEDADFLAYVDDLSSLVNAYA
ncbi:MAG: DUF4375 domain-containing protein [Pseudomonadota bacterium]